MRYYFFFLSIKKGISTSRIGRCAYPLSPPACARYYSIDKLRALSCLHFFLILRNATQTFDYNLHLLETSISLILIISSLFCNIMYLFCRNTQHIVSSARFFLKQKVWCVPWFYNYTFTIFRSTLLCSVLYSRKHLINRWNIAEIRIMRYALFHLRLYHNDFTNLLSFHVYSVAVNVAS